MVFSLFRKRTERKDQIRRPSNRGALFSRVARIEINIKKLEETLEIQQRAINKVRMRQIRSETNDLPYDYSSILKHGS